MGVIFMIVFFLVSLFIVGLVLLQEGKGGGLTGMSTGMDGIMGAKNPLRRMTAYLFIFFVLLTFAINYHFYTNEEQAVPTGIELPQSSAIQLEENAPVSGPQVVDAESLRPEAPAPAPETGDTSEPIRPPSAEAETSAPQSEPVTPPAAETTEAAGTTE